MASAPVVVDQSPAKPPRVLTCVSCQRRKIKCDRNNPCSNCVKANTHCTPTSRAPSRKRRRPNRELQARLARCEELLQEYASLSTGDPERPRGADASLPSQVTAYEVPSLNWKPAGKLVVEDGAVRFTNNFLWATIYDELRTMREIMESDGYNSEKGEWHPSATTPDYSDDVLLGGDSPLSDVKELQPTPTQIFRLWQVYLNRVNPLTKIIHVPTFQPYLVDVTSGLVSIPKNMEALLFAIYAMAVVSLTEKECIDILGVSKNDASQRFSRAVRISLIGARYLKSHNLITLQALVLYLLSLQGRYNSHATWILNGTCIRIAQKMGLHRDGELLGLSPFDTEMRRRIWWQIVMIDANCALRSGLTHSLLPRSGDCKLPKNINDADLHPSATQHFQDRNGPTEMIFCLIGYTVGEFLLRRHDLESTILHGEMHAVIVGPYRDGSKSENRELVKDLEDSLTRVVERFLDVNAGPVHELALQMRTSISHRLRDMVLQPHEQPEWGSEILTPKDNLFKLAVTATKQAVEQYAATMDRGLLWFMQSFFQYDVFLYMVGQLCHRTLGRLVEQAWEYIPVVYQYHEELLDISQESTMTLATFVLKAWELRERVLRTRLGRVPDPPDYIARLQDIMPLDDNTATVESDVLLFFTHPSTEPNSSNVERSWDHLFPGYFGATAPDWDASLMPPSENIEEQLSASDWMVLARH